MQGYRFYSVARVPIGSSLTVNFCILCQLNDNCHISKPGFASNLYVMLGSLVVVCAISGCQTTLNFITRRQLSAIYGAISHSN